MPLGLPMPNILRRPSVPEPPDHATCPEPIATPVGQTHALWMLVSVVLLAAASANAQLLVVSQGDARILEYDELDGTFVAPFVAPITTGFAFPGGIAVHPSDGNVYVSSTASGEIWAYDLLTGLVAPPAIATGLLAPTAMTLDATGSNLYFLADIPNGPDTDAALRRLALPGGTVTTVSSDSAASFAGLALEGSHLYVSDSFAGRIVRYSTSGGSGTPIVTGLTSPSGILFPSSTVMLIAETGADRVVEYVESGGTWSFNREILNSATGINGPTGLALGPDGRLSVSGSLSNDVVAVDLTTLASTTLVASGNGLAVAGELEWDGNTLLVASRSNNTVPFFDSNGDPTGVVARGLTAPADAGMATLSNGNVLIGSVGANSVSEIDSQSGGTIRTLPNACPASFTSVFDVATDSAGDVYMTCPPTDGVRRFDSNGTSVPFVAIASGGLGSPRGLVFGPNGNLFVASGSGEILEYQIGTGNFVGAFVDVTGNGGGPIDPYGFVFHQGSLFVTSFFPSEVREFDASTGAYIQTFVSSGAGGLSGPSGLAFGSDGDLYVTSKDDDSVKRFAGDTGTFIENFVSTASGGLDQPFDLIFVPMTPGLPVPSGSLHARALSVLILIACSVRSRRSRGSVTAVRGHSK